MPRRKLGNLANLNTKAPRAFSNTAKTLKRKWKELNGQENVAPETVGRPKKLQKTRRKPKNTSSSDVSSHSASSHQSVPRRVLSSILNAVSPSRLSRPSSRTSDIPTDFPFPSQLSDTLDNGSHGHRNSLGATSGSSDPFEELVTDPRVIVVQEGEDDASNGYSNPPPAPDDEDYPDADPPPTKQGTPWETRQPPTQVMALEALEAIKLLLFVPSAPGKRKHTVATKINGWSRKHLEEISAFLSLYTDKESKTRGEWTASSVQAAVSRGKGKGGRDGHARGIRERARNPSLQVNPFGTWAKSKLETHPELAEELKEHLVSIGKYVQARDIVDFLNRPDMQTKHNISESIHISTAQRWMHALKFRWVKNHKGQYVDGHERADVVQFRQEVFLPAWYSMEGRMRAWKGNNMETLEDVVELINEAGKQIVVWFHDESIFYAHDRRTSQWVADDASPSPYAKGEGVSLMVADFVSADYGWLRSKDGLESAQVIFRPGKNRDGYFSNEDILDQLAKAMDILEHDYPDDTGGKEFYYGPNTERPGVFKGMAVILRERGIDITYRNDQNQVKELNAQCPGFHCPPENPGCCCRRILYNQPDFTNGLSLLEIAAEKRGFKILFLPKFHCELNFIEMCWGKAKRLYRLNPPSSKEEDVEKNMLKALDAVTITDMRK
ncbi:hypothetical protein DFH07DRAFT_964918 [Mycena maculata]|uniref:Uncharacterized protein n=1 Tax=Mycena maculata TaxID=230809 RepID=A0AAD7N2H6_9AGAR|nr:hypothetical protein DFH07DRAFT_964918 [Mycena maculata]